MADSEITDFTDWLRANRMGKTVSAAMLEQAVIGFRAMQIRKARLKTTAAWYGNWIEERSR